MYKHVMQTVFQLHLDPTNYSVVIPKWMLSYCIQANYSKLNYVLIHKFKLRLDIECVLYGSLSSLQLELQQENMSYNLSSILNDGWRMHTT